MAKKAVKKKKPSKAKIELTCEDGDCSCDHSKKSSGCGSGIYGLGIIGSLFYFISTATSFWMGVLGVLKSIVWPAFLVYELFKFLLA